MAIHPSTSNASSALLVALTAAASAAITYLIMRPTRQVKGGIEVEAGEEVGSKYHRLIPALQMAGRAKIDRAARRFFRDRPNATHVIRVALTGGPCAGKSSALDHLRARATARGFDVYCAPEVATLIFNSGYLVPTDTDQIFQFQNAVCNLQLSIERNLTKIVERTGRPSIIIFDRGLLDAKGYMTKEMWRRVLEEMITGSGDNSGGTGETPGKGVTEEYCLKRYDGVIHLVTAADGAEEYYKSGTVTDDSGHAVIRKETPEEARELDKKMREVWSAHPRQHVIGNEGSFQDKLERASDAIMALAEETHPLQVTQANQNVSASTNGVDL